MIVVVGIGADGMDGLAGESKRELRNATVIYGSSRQLDLLDDTVTASRNPWPSPMMPGLQRLADGRTADIHVLASGDPLLHGVGGTLIRMFGADRVRVLPHVSSATLACARLGWVAQDTEVISVVSAPVHLAVRRGGRAVVLSRDGESPGVLAQLLTENGRGATEFTVLEQIGGPDERIRSATADDWAAAPPADVDDLNVIAVRYLPDERIGQVLPDDLFRHDGQITKQLMRSLTLTSLGPRPGELLWDVGSGAGSIAIEWCRSGNGCGAVAFESEADRRERISANARAFGVSLDVRGSAPEEFVGVDPDVVFVGGGLTNPGLIAACLDRLKPGGRLVANSVTVESEAVLLDWYGRIGGELRRFQHYGGEPLGGFTAWRPQLPITQWSVVVS